MKKQRALFRRDDLRRTSLLTGQSPRGPSPPAPLPFRERGVRHSDSNAGNDPAIVPPSFGEAGGCPLACGVERGETIAPLPAGERGGGEGSAGPNLLQRPDGALLARRLMAASWLLFAALALLPGCGSDSAASVNPGAAPNTGLVTWWGGRGSISGRFQSPRGLAVDRQGNVYVVDLSCRVQKFTPDGKHLLTWTLPSNQVGNPEDLATDRDGNILVTDTHYYRILRFSTEGKLLDEFGTRGEGPGQFIFPVGLAVGTDGSIYVSEYGGNDRIQVFSHEGKFLRQWGKFGDAPGEFNRPQDVAVDDAHDRVYVADAANHRIQVFTREGAFVRIIGQAGQGAADLCYPYGLDWYQGRLIVTEYGNDRVREVDLEGTGRAVLSWGQTGRDPGSIHTPWHTVHDATGACYVADTDNNRVQKFRWR